MLLGATASKQRQGLVNTRLIGLMEVIEGSEGGFQVLVVPHGVRVETTAAHIEQLVPQHIPDSAHLTVVPQYLAQGACSGVTPAVAEYREVDGNQRDIIDIQPGFSDQRFGALMALQPHSGQSLALFDEILSLEPTVQWQNEILLLKSV